MKYPLLFEKFWNLYPGRTNKRGRIIKQDKLGACAEWRKLTRDERALALTGHPAQGQYTPDARKWLKHKRWEDEDVTEQKRKAQIELNRRLRANEQRDTWSSWIKKQSKDTLKTILNDYPHIAWLVRELKPEIFDDTAKGGD